MSKRKNYLVSNWEGGIKHGTIITANGLEVDTYDRSYNTGSDGVTSSNNAITLSETGYKIQITNTSGSTQSTVLHGFYDNLDVAQLYRLVVNKQDSITEKDDAGNKTLAYEAFGLQGLFEFYDAEHEIKLTMPAGAKWYLYATDGGYLSPERFKQQRRPANELDNSGDSYYITELFRYNKLEDITQFFLPLVDAYDLKKPTESVSISAYVASSDKDSTDFSGSGVSWVPIQEASSIVTRSKPYFRFKVVMPTNRVVACKKIGYSIHTEYGYAEPPEMFLSVSDVEQTVYRPKFQVSIAGKDVTPFVDSVSSGQVVLNIRKIDERRSDLYMQNISIVLDGVTVESGRVTGVNKTEYPNAVTYTLRFTSYRDLLGVNYQDTTFAFNAAPSDVSTVPFANEFEYINFIVNYSPASNGIILNTEKFANMRSMNFWTDAYDMINRTGGMGFAESPDKWVHYYTNPQKLTLEQINLVANANRLAAEVTHTGSVILSDLIPYPDQTLSFDAFSYHKDERSLLSKCTHRYHDYVSTNTNGTEIHTYIPDHRLYVPEVNYDILQAASIVRVNGTTGKNQVAVSATEQYIGTVTGFDKGESNYVQGGKELNYRTQLTTTQPSDSFRIAFFTKNQITGNPEQTVLRGTPKVEGWENVTYETDKGGLFQPTIQSAPAGLKVEQKWIEGSLVYEDGDFDDVYGVKFLEVNISTEDLRDEPMRQGLMGAALGFVIGVVAVIAIVASGGTALPLIGAAYGAVGAAGVIGGATVVGFALGAGNGTYVSRINVQLPLKIKGIPGITAHQEYQESPLIGLPDGKWFPRWAPAAYQDMLQVRDNLGIEPKVVDNPYVVSLTNYQQPNPNDYGDVDALKQATKDSVYNKESHNIIASGLTLREWLKARAVTLKYAGNPNWYPYQFIAIAKPPTQGSYVTEYEYFYTLGPQATNITVGGEINTEVQAAYIGSSNGNRDVRFMELLNNSLTLN